MSILLVSKNNYNLSGIRCVKSFENIEWDNISALIFHSTLDDDMKVMYHLSTIRNKVKKVIYINSHINPLFYCIFTGLDADIYDSEAYLEDVSVLDFLVGSYKETGMTMKSADESLNILAKSIASISSAPIEGLQRLLTNDYWTKTLTTAVSNLESDLSMVSQININVVEMMTETMKLIKDLEANNEKTDSEIEVLRATIRKMEDEENARLNIETPSTLYKFPQYTVPVNISKVLYFKVYGQCRYLNSFVLAYQNYLNVSKHLNTKVLFVVPKLPLQIKKYQKFGVRLAQESIHMADYSSKVFVTFEPRKQVLDAFFNQQGVVNYIVIDLMFGDELLKGHMVKKFSAVGSLSEIELFKLDPERTLVPIVARPENIFIGHIKDYAKAPIANRINLYYDNFKDTYEKVDRLSK